MAQGPGTVDPSALAPWISTGLARDALAAGHAGQGEVRGPLARLEAAAAGAAGRGRLQLLQPPTQQAQGPQATPPGTLSITADGTANVLVAGLTANQLAVSTGLEGPWQTLGEPGRDPAYPG